MTEREPQSSQIFSANELQNLKAVKMKVRLGTLSGDTAPKSPSLFTDEKTAFGILGILIGIEIGKFFKNRINF